MYSGCCIDTYDACKKPKRLRIGIEKEDPALVLGVFSVWVGWVKWWVVTPILNLSHGLLLFTFVVLFWVCLLGLFVGVS